MALVSKNVCSKDPQLKHEARTGRHLKAVDIVLPAESVDESQSKVEYSKEGTSLFYASVVKANQTQISFQLLRFDLSKEPSEANHVAKVFDLHRPTTNPEVEVSKWKFCIGGEGECIGAEVAYNFRRTGLRNRSTRARVLVRATRQAIDFKELNETERIAVSSRKLRLTNFSEGTIDAILRLHSPLRIASFSPVKACGTTPVSMFEVVSLDYQQMLILINQIELRSIPVSNLIQSNSISPSQPSISYPLFSKSFNSGVKIVEDVICTAISPSGNRIAVITEKSVFFSEVRIRVYNTAQDPIKLHWTGEFRKKMFRWTFGSDWSTEPVDGLTIPQIELVALCDNHLAVYNCAETPGKAQIFNLDEADAQIGGRWVGNEPDSRQEWLEDLKFTEDGEEIVVLFKTGGLLPTGTGPWGVALYLTNSFADNFKTTKKPSQGTCLRRIPFPWKELYRPTSLALSPALIAVSTTTDLVGDALIGLIRKSNTGWVFWGNHKTVQALERVRPKERNNTYTGIKGIQLYCPYFVEHPLTSVALMMRTTKRTA
jgi:hypothetical protein